jgi:hypothetical protein
MSTKKSSGVGLGLYFADMVISFVLDLKLQEVGNERKN